MMFAECSAPSVQQVNVRWVSLEPQQQLPPGGRCAVLPGGVNVLEHLGRRFRADFCLVGVFVLNFSSDPVAVPGVFPPGNQEPNMKTVSRS